MKLIVYLVIIFVGVFVANKFFIKRDSLGAEKMTGVSLDNSLLVDVRTKEEYAEGHFPGSVNIPIDTIEKNLDVFKATEKENIILVCRSGGRAGTAQAYLKKVGITKNTFNYGAWQNLENLK